MFNYSFCSFQLINSLLLPTCKFLCLTSFNVAAIPLGIYCIKCLGSSVYFTLPGTVHYYCEFLLRCVSSLNISINMTNTSIYFSRQVKLPPSISDHVQLMLSKNVYSIPYIQSFYSELFPQQSESVILFWSRTLQWDCVMVCFYRFFILLRIGHSQFHLGLSFSLPGFCKCDIFPLSQAGLSRNSAALLKRALSKSCCFCSIYPRGDWWAGITRGKIFSWIFPFSLRAICQRQQVTFQMTLHQTEPIWNDILLLHSLRCLLCPCIYLLLCEWLCVEVHVHLSVDSAGWEKSVDAHESHWTLQMEFNLPQIIDFLRLHAFHKTF